MKIKYILAAASVALMMPAQAMAHHDHYDHDHHGNSDLVAPLVLGAAIIGGSIILNNNRNNHYDHHHHRRGRRGRVIDTYRRGGHTFRVCRRGGQVFYC